MLNFLERIRPVARLLASSQAVSYVLPLGGFCLLGSLVIIQYSPSTPVATRGPATALHRVITDEIDLTREGHGAAQVADVDAPPEAVAPPIGKPDREMATSPLADADTATKSDATADAGDANVAMAAPPAPDVPAATPTDIMPRHEQILGETPTPQRVTAPRAAAPPVYQEGFDPTRPVKSHVASRAAAPAKPAPGATKAHKPIPPPPGEVVDIPMPPGSRLDDQVENLRQSSQNDLAQHNTMATSGIETRMTTTASGKATEVPPLPNKSWTPSFADMEIPSLPMPATMGGNSLMGATTAQTTAMAPPKFVDTASGPSHIAVSQNGPVSIMGRIVKPGVGGAPAHNLVYLVDMSSGQTIHGSTDANGSFSFSGLKPGTLYYIAAWFQQRNVDGVRYNGQIPVANVKDTRLSWHQAIQPTQGGSFSLELNEYNADSAYCADVIPNAVVETPNSSWRRAELLPLGSDRST